MDDKIEIVGFQKEYRMLTTKLKKDKPELFNLGVIVAYTSEIENCFMVKKQLKTTSSGTKFNYEAIKSKEELEDYTEKVSSLTEALGVEAEIEKMKKILENK